MPMLKCSILVIRRLEVSHLPPGSFTLSAVASTWACELQQQGEMPRRSLMRCVYCVMLLVGLLGGKIQLAMLCCGP
eukprot:1161685-Pelagomonas_calceolata.AAC.6